MLPGTQGPLISRKDQATQRNSWLAGVGIYNSRPIPTKTAMLSRVNNLLVRVRITSMDNRTSSRLADPGPLALQEPAAAKDNKRYSRVTSHITCPAQMPPSSKITRSRRCRLSAHSRIAATWSKVTTRGSAGSRIMGNSNSVFSPRPNSVPQATKLPSSTVKSVLRLISSKNCLST